MIVLIIHLVVCVCLIGLVLLQRSEGGALGMGGGGGGGGSLMSGRGAADALAKMTSVAGGFFLVTSLGLSVLSGAASNASGVSVFDRTPAPAAAPATTAPPPVTAPEPTRPDPTESSAPQAAETQLVSIGPASAAAATPNA
jgi:preprotein translocase subunit SecG